MKSIKYFTENNVKINLGILIKPNIRNYVLFTMFSAPFIDLLNSLYGNTIPVGKLTRTCLLLLNLYFMLLHIPNKLRMQNGILVFVAFYLIIHSLFLDMFFINGTLTHNFNFSTKLLLFLSEMMLIINSTERRIIGKADIEMFWKFSCWFVPASLLGAKIFNITSSYMKTNAGLYSSVNAMSIILIIQFILSIYYAGQNYKYWGAVLLNALATALLGTKSPYLFIAVVICTLLLFYSKHRLRMLVFILAGFFLAYFFLGKFFSAEIGAILSYQKSYISSVKNNQNTIWGYLFSGRNVMLQNTWNEIKAASLSFVAIIFGVGHSTLGGIEMDLFEILLSSGIIVTFLIYMVLLNSFRWNCTDKNRNLFLNLALVCMLAFSTLGGHTFLESIAGTYSAILIGYKYACKGQA